MSTYVDGFLLPLRKENLEVYRGVAQRAAEYWIEHGALAYHECAGDDLEIAGMLSLAESAGCREGETVIFAWIEYASREDRDRINAKIMTDPRIAAMMEDVKGVFDCERMGYGGFKTLVSLTAEARTRGKGAGIVGQEKPGAPSPHRRPETEL